MIHSLKIILDYLENEDIKPQDFEVVVGFDGYIDNLVHPVKRIKSPNNHSFFETISVFGDYIKSKANKSCSIELETFMKKMGGNTPIFGNAIANLGIKTKCIGAFGYPKMDALFCNNHPNVEMISIANPGYCTALEFIDGKIMLADNKGINELNYNVLEERCNEEKLIEIFEKVNIISLMNWSEVAGSINIWEGILKNIFPKIKHCYQKQLFVDISDCTSRCQEDILKLVDLLSHFSKYCEIILSLNQNEFDCLRNSLEIQGEIEEAGNRLMDLAHLTYLVVHVLDGAYAITKKGIIFVKNKHVKCPEISTGGGDNFNAGLVYGFLVGMPFKEVVLFGNVTSGYYVTNAKSPSISKSKEFIREWIYDIESKNK